MNIPSRKFSSTRRVNMNIISPDNNPRVIPTGMNKILSETLEMIVAEATPSATNRAVNPILELNKFNTFPIISPKKVPNWKFSTPLSMALKIMEFSEQSPAVQSCPVVRKSKSIKIMNVIK